MCEISVIVPVYNMELKLKRCIDSILNQTFKNFELILIDDGSTDNSGNICDKYSESDGRVSVTHTENRGVAAAKNLGISKAKGMYLNFIDSDDYVDPNYLSDMIECNNGYDMIISGVKYISPDKLGEYAKLDYNRDAEIKKCDYCKYIPFLLEARALNYHVAKLYKRDIVEKNKILFTDFNLTGADDTVFNFDVLSKCEMIYVINKCMYNYVIYDNSTSRKFCIDTFKRRKAIDSFLLKKTEEMCILDEKMKKVINIRFVISSYWSACTLAELRYREFKKYFLDIANDKRFRSAYEDTYGYEYDAGVFYIYKKKCFQFWHYKRRTKDAIKGCIIRIVPKPLHNLYRKAKGNIL